MLGSGSIAKGLIAAGVCAVLAGCGDPKYQPPPIVVTFFSPPPASMTVGSSTGITAVVANDPKNAGVNFTCSPAGDCGTFSPDSVASNVPTSYQAPSTVPAGGSVTVTATSVTDSSKSVSATITID